MHPNSLVSASLHLAAPLQDRSGSPPPPPFDIHLPTAASHISPSTQAGEQLWEKSSRFPHTDALRIAASEMDGAVLEDPMQLAVKWTFFYCSVSDHPA